MVKAVVFDLDGTIGNTLPLCIAAFREAVEPYMDRALSDGDIIATFGPSEEGTIMQLIPDHYSEGVEAYLHHYARLHDRCPTPFDGIREIIDKLRSAGLTVALVTGKGARSCEITLARYGLSEVFDTIETGSPAGQRKKQGIEAVMAAYGLNPDELIYVGDAPGDIEVCHALGVPIVAAAWAETADPEALLPLCPHRIFHSVVDFNAYIDIEILGTGITGYK
ncbi:MAG: HAD family hydrolase [Alistipes sp.]|nr:HAD family hydrolase [Alistipes sp.]